MNFIYHSDIFYNPIITGNDRCGTYSITGLPDEDIVSGSKFKINFPSTKSKFPLVFIEAILDNDPEFLDYFLNVGEVTEEYFTVIYTSGEDPPKQDVTIKFSYLIIDQS